MKTKPVFLNKLSKVNFDVGHIDTSTRNKNIYPLSFSQEIDQIFLNINVRC